jgi:YbbR domain-containing protein
MMTFFRDLFTRNRGPKLLAFFLALLIWLILIPEEKTYSDKTMTVPLETRNVPPDMELVEKPAATIEVTVRARNRLLNELTPSGVFARLDLGRASVYQDIYPLNGSMITVPPGAEVVGISPAMVRLKLEKTKQMDLEVAPMIVGKVGEGLRIVRIEVAPARVPVKGPESKIRIKDKVSTSPVDVSLLTQSTTVEADIILPKADLRLATTLTKVRIQIILEENAKTPNNKGSRTG